MSVVQPLPTTARTVPHVPGGGAAAKVDRAETPASNPDPNLVQEMRQEIRNLVQEIARLAQTETSSGAFFSGFLPRVVSALASAGGAVWMAGPGNSSLELIYQINLADSGLEADSESRQKHAAMRARVMASGQVLLVPQKSGKGTEDLANPTEFLLVLAPLRLEQQIVGVVEVFQRPGGGPATQRGYARFLGQMCDLAADHLKSHRFRELAERQELWQQLEGFLHSIHCSLDLRATSYAIVNEGRRLIGCDRVSLALGDGRRAVVTTVSGLDSIDRRASEVRRLSLLARSILRTGEPLWHAGDGTELPPQIDEQLQPYLDLSHARLVAVLPLIPPAATGEGSALSRRPLGALIIEQLSDNRAGASLRSRAETVARHSAAALAHAVEHHDLPLLPLWRLVGKLTWFLRGRALPWTLAVLVVLAAGAFGLATIPADFDVAAPGKLQPVQRRDVFARIDGDVIRVPVTHGQMVQRGDLLAELSNNELAEELQRLIGRQKTNQEQVSSTNKRLLDSARGSGSRLTPADEAKLAGDLLELKQEADNIRRELDVFYEKQRRLKVIADQPGQVVTWKVQEQLQRRPVVRGQVLMTLANPEGPWELELYLPERRLKHVLEAQADHGAGRASAVAPQRSLAERIPADRDQRSSLDVIFALASHPGAEFRGQVVEIEQTAEVRGENGNTVLVRVAVDRDELPHLHDQTTVTAKIHCGRRSVGFVWFCDLIETAQSKVLFWF